MQFNPLYYSSALHFTDSVKIQHIPAYILAPISLCVY